MCVTSEALYVPSLTRLLLSSVHVLLLLLLHADILKQVNFIIFFFVSAFVLVLWIKKKTFKQFSKRHQRRLKKGLENSILSAGLSTSPNWDQSSGGESERSYLDYDLEIMSTSEGNFDNYYGDNSSLLDISQNCPINDLKSNLASWAVDNNISIIALTSLLKLLKTHECHNNLPADGRTLLKTPQSIDLKVVKPGNYVHIGLKIQLEKKITEMFSDFNEVELLVHFDGLPLSKSSKSSLWPILGSISGPSDVILIGIYHGYEKPKSPNSFIQYFIEEVKQLTSEGVNFKNKVIPFRLKAVICDAPAKSFILCVKGHGGYSSCTKCRVEGQYFDNRICFPDTNSIKRKDVDYINKVDEEFHNEGAQSLLESVSNFGLVTNVPLDYMHLVCLSVVRKLLNLWIRGSLNGVRIQYQNVNKISTNLLTLRSNVPVEFSQKP